MTKIVYFKPRFIRKISFSYLQEIKFRSIMAFVGRMITPRSGIYGLVFCGMQNGMQFRVRFCSSTYEA
jgi:hypothetical protein